METLTKPTGIILATHQPTIYLVIGCGGTGSYLIRDLARMISIGNEKYSRKDSILLCDADKVEPKNLARQNFIKSDIDQNKAKVLSERYSTAYNVEIGYIDSYVNKEDILQIINTFQNNFVILGCVDNNETRHMIHDAIESHDDSHNGGIIYIDAGNEQYAGQVVLSFSNFFTTNGCLNYMTFNPDRPKDVVKYFMLENDKRHPSNLSCGELAVSAPQNIATNILSANCIFNFCNIIINSSGIMYFGHYSDNNMVSMNERAQECIPIYSNLVYFNSATNTIVDKKFEDNFISFVKDSEKKREEKLKNFKPV